MQEAGSEGRIAVRKVKNLHKAGYWKERALV